MFKKSSRAKPKFEVLKKIFYRTRIWGFVFKFKTIIFVINMSTE